ncbi:toll/interleukin-1 receptor domain-containing protein [uncultured Kordia sp.]|uniref:toll/interleukin-1 receptor domain-containing protein n=1 Tax=uncultured Kordia sp. TaxID=507699 RepID=UPI002630D0AF|nr:toll/interleukin-1 receptor domain-containing protein [uncultured Kordia sp.]
MDENYKHDVAISFARADRSIALCIYLALKLKTPESEAYYYPNKQAEMIGRNLKNELKEIYRHKSKYVILIVSKDYVNKNNEFVQTEINAFMPRYLMEKSVYIIPIIVDGTDVKKVHEELEGITTFAWDYNPEKLATLIHELLCNLERKSDELPIAEGEKQSDKIIINNSSFDKSPIITDGGTININY